MANLQNYNGRYCESEYEYAFLSFLEEEGWQYMSGNSIPRSTKSAVLYADDMEQFLCKTNADLTADEIHQIIDKVRLVGAESEFSTLHTVYGWMVDGVRFTPQNGRTRMIPLIDFENPESNIFRAVNQFAVEYTNNGMKETRRPDILLFVNGMPLCIIELKNPADANATIYDAWEQINIRYWRDIPHLLHYCPLACISDGVKTRLGTVRTPYEHFYAWRRVNDGDKVSTLPFEETQTMIKGVYAPERFLEIFRDYIYFQDSEYDSDEREIVCRYPQFFAARLLKQSIVKSVEAKSGKGGTYFGATGCGKTYTMAFLARQLALRCPELGSPTVIMIVDRDELQKQGAKLFTKSKEFLNLGEVCVVPNRNKLREELGARESGGFYICTIQKFCDREDDKIGLINNRANIICFSDEAHRTQLEHAKSLKFSKDADENMRAMVSKPYAKVLKEALPNATFVGFTGTPISETYQTFGDEIDRYTMDQAVADGLTVSIKYHPRIAKVLLDQEKAKQIETYYKKCFEDGATAEDIEASKNAYKIDVIIFAADDECIKNLHAYAETKFHSLNDNYRRYIAKIDSDRFRRQYDSIVSDGDIVSKHNFRLPETIQVAHEDGGEKYSDHLFVNANTGTAVMKLNSWEEGVIAEEEKNPDFVCWLRNPPRKSWSLCIPYEMDNETKPAYPDFIIVRKDAISGYVIDILEPHNPEYIDNLGKAKGFAEYARQNPGVGRIQLIRMAKDISGKDRFKRLDMSMSAVRDKVSRAINNDELDHIFDTDGFFM